MRLFLMICLFACASVSSVRAQGGGSISGCLWDSVAHQQLQGASILLLGAGDSVALRPGVVSNSDACFELTAVRPGKYILRIAFVGYESYYKSIEVRGNARVDLGTIGLRIKAENLNSVTIVAPPLLVVKKDTLEYNAAAVKIREYDDLQDLLRKMPGLQIAADGTLLANGERVEQLLVDGKPFFGGDPATALQNLPAGIVDKVQVYKARSDKEKFTGFSQGPGRQTVNITVKRNMAKGDFGKAGAGAGTQNTWAAGLNLNHFDGPQQITLLGSANNINNQSSPVSATPFNDQSNAGNPGILRNMTAGINYRDSRNSHTEGNGSYLYSDRHVTNLQQNIIQNFFPGDSSTTSHQQVASSTTGSGQNLSFKLAGKPDAASVITFSPGFVIQQSTADGSQQSFLTGRSPQDTVYRSANQSVVTNNSKVFSSDLAFMHQFHKTGGSLVIGVKLAERNNRIDNLSRTQTEVLLPARYDSRLNKLISQATNSGTVNPTISYTQPIDKHQSVQIDYEYTWRPNRSTNQTYDYNNDNGKFDHIDSTQSNDYRYVNETQLVSGSYRLQLDKWQLVAGFGWRWDVLSQRNISLGELFKKQYKGPAPSATLNYSITANKSLQMTYSGSVVELSVQQLQPVSITADSLFIQKGNPLLRQPFKQAFSLSYQSLQPRRMRIFSVSLNGDVTQRAVSNSVVQLPNGAQVNMPVNMNGNFDLSLNASYGIPVKKWATSLTVSGNAGYVQTPELLNLMQAETRSWNSGVTLSSTTTIRNKIDWTTDLSVGYNGYRYAFGTAQAEDYFSMRALSRVSYYVGRWVLSMNASYTFNNGLPAGFRPDVLLLSPALSHRVFRNKAGEIRLLVFDLFDQNSGITRTVSDNRIINMQSQVRGRYGMISFTYTFRHFPGLAHPE